MIIGVFGPGHLRRQEYDNYAYVAGILDEYEGIKKVVTGGGVGVETLALRYAALQGIDKETVPPNIKAHGTPNAFIFRNKDIIEQVELVLLLWDGNPLYHQLMLDTILKGKLLHVRSVE